MPIPYNNIDLLETLQRSKGPQCRRIFNNVLHQFLEVLFTIVVKMKLILRVKTEAFQCGIRVRKPAQDLPDGAWCFVDADLEIFDPLEVPWGEPSILSESWGVANEAVFCV